MDRTWETIQEKTFTKWYISVLYSYRLDLQINFDDLLTG